MSAAPAADAARRDGAGLLWAAAVPLLALLGLPLAALALFLTPGSLVEHLRSPQALAALGLSLRTTLAATLLCVLLGTPVAYLLARVRFRGRDALDTLVDLPVTIPPVVAGVGLLLVLGRRGLLGRQLDLLGVQVAFTTAAVVLAQLFMASPFYVKAARAGFLGVDARLEDAARTLGAGRWRVFWTVTAPLARPALLSGVLLAWARALSEFGATMMFAGNFPGRTQTLTLAVMSAMESDLDTAVALSALSLALGICALVAARVLSRRWGVGLG